MEVKKILNDKLIELGIIKSNTEQIVININCGAISDFKVVERFK
jgi:hypothetical protein